MAHHKRRRPKNRRAGCLLCKYHKMNGAKRGRWWSRRSDLRARVELKEQLNATATSPEA